MKQVSGHPIEESFTPSVLYTHESLLLSSDVQASVLSDVFSRVESRFNHFRSVDPSARVAAISDVDKEIDATWIRLRSLRNSLAPISALPPEVLASVFHFLSLKEPSCYPVKQHLGWIRVTHVCHLWRQVALGDSSLWARITEISREISINTEFIYQMLARARDAPLDIDIDLCQTRGSIVLLMISPHLSHTRKLRLHSLSESDLDGFRRICSQEALALEHFTLNLSASSLSTSLELGGTMLFKGAPKLRSFSLYYAFIPWSLIPRGQLTHLEISLALEASNYIDSSHGNLNQLIDLLVNCSELKILVLESCLPSQLSEFPRGQTIDLPRLSRLGLGGSSSRITNLLKMLKLPSTTALQLYCIFKNNSLYNDHWHSLLPVVSAHFQSTARIELKSLRVTINCRECRLSVIASTSSLAARICQSLDFKSDVLDNDCTFLELFELPEHGHWADLIEQLFEMLPISNLEALSISAPDLLDSINWVEVLKRCTKVSTMEIIGGGESSLVRALTTPSTSAQKHTPILPNLASLSLKGFYFAEDKHPSGILFDVIQEGLRQRMVECRALKVLHVESCTIGSKRAKALEGLVQTFRWDEMDIFNKPDFYDSDSDEPEL